MHWEGQTTMQRPQATHLVFPRSSFSKYWGPLHLGAGGVLSSGYWTVTGLEKNIFKVSFKPFNKGMIIYYCPFSPNSRLLPHEGKDRGNFKYIILLMP